MAEADDGRLAIVDGSADGRAEAVIWQRDAAGTWSAPVRLPFALLVPLAWFDEGSLMLGGHPCPAPVLGALEGGDVASDACEVDSPYTIGGLGDGGDWTPAGHVAGSHPGEVRAVVGSTAEVWLSRNTASGPDRAVEFFRVDADRSSAIVRLPGSKSVHPDASTKFCGGSPPLWIEERFDQDRGVMVVEAAEELTSEGPRPITWTEPPVEEGMVVCEGSDLRAVSTIETDTHPPRRLVIDRGVVGWEEVEQPQGPTGAVFRTYSGRKGTVAFVPIGIQEGTETYRVEVRRGDVWEPVGEVETGGVFMEVGTSSHAVTILYSSSVGFSLTEFDL